MLQEQSPITTRPATKQAKSTKSHKRSIKPQSRRQLRFFKRSHCYLPHRDQTQITTRNSRSLATVGRAGLPASRVTCQPGTAISSRTARRPRCSPRGGHVLLPAPLPPPREPRRAAPTPGPGRCHLRLPACFPRLRRGPGGVGAVPRTSCGYRSIPPGSRRFLQRSVLRWCFPPLRAAPSPGAFPSIPHTSVPPSPLPISNPPPVTCTLSPKSIPPRQRVLSPRPVGRGEGGGQSLIRVELERKLHA